MAFLKQTYVSGNLFVTESGAFVSATHFYGTASLVDPNQDQRMKTLHVTNDAQVDGDLKVLGDLTYVGVKDLRVKDHLIELNVDESGSASAAADGGGIVLRNSEAAGDIELIYSASDDRLHVNKIIAGTVEKVEHKATFKFKDAAGTASADIVFDGSADKTYSVDFSPLETKVHASASVADLQDQIDAIAGSGSGQIDTKIREAIEALDADAGVVAAGTQASGGVFVLTEVAFDERDGKLTSGSFEAVEVDPAGAAEKVRVALSSSLGEISSSINTRINDVNSDLSSSLGSISGSINERINNEAATASANLTAASQSISSSLNTVSSSLNTRITNESSSFSSSLSSSVYTLDTRITNVSSSIDERINNEAATASANLTALSESVAESIATASSGSTEALDEFKQEYAASQSAYSTSVANSFATESATRTALSESVATSFSASDAARVALSESVASSSLAYSQSVATSFSASDAARVALSESVASSSVAYSASAAAAFVNADGDAMTGNLNMASNAVIFGDMKMVWNATDQSIDFIPVE